MWALRCVRPDTPEAKGPYKHAAMHAVSFRRARAAVLQADNRLCTPPDNMTAPRGYWWKTVQINSMWAAVHGYSHLSYCIPRCRHATASKDAPLSPAWCKLLAIQDALLWNRWDVVMYLDSDAFWNHTHLGLDALDAHTWPEDWHTAGGAGASLFFGCNLPYAAEDFGRRRWNTSWTNGERGPANTGVIVARNSLGAHLALARWWAVPLSNQSARLEPALTCQRELTARPRAGGTQLTRTRVGILGLRGSSLRFGSCGRTRALRQACAYSATQIQRRRQTGVG